MSFTESIIAKCVNPVKSTVKMPIATGPYVKEPVDSTFFTIQLIEESFIDVFSYVMESFFSEDRDDHEPVVRSPERFFFGHDKNLAILAPMTELARDMSSMIPVFAHVNAWSIDVGGIESLFIPNPCTYGSGAITHFLMCSATASRDADILGDSSLSESATSMR